MDKQHITLVEAIYREHKDHLYNYIQRMCNDPELSHDIVQSVFIKLLSDPKISAVEYQKAYLFTIARNALFDEMKRKKPVYFEDSEQAQEAAVIDDSEMSLQEQTEEAVLTMAIDKAIGNMPEKFRELMLLRYTEDLSIQEIAEITERNLSDIKVNLHRARLAFENRFTATMYSKVAASRKRCDILVGMIAPYGDSDIPMPEIPKIEKHIAQCVSCNEDATTMKRRRELFALLPILIAPSLWDDIMKEAQASTLDQASGMKGGDKHGGDHATSLKTATNTVNTAAKISALKIVSITVIIVGVIVGGVILSKLLPFKENNTPLVSAPPITPTLPPASPNNTTGLVASGNTATSPSLSTQSGQVASTSSSKPAQPVASNQAQTTVSPQQLAKLNPAVPQSSLPSATPTPAKPTRVNPDKDKAKGMWLYDGPPITAHVEQKVDAFSDKDDTTIYLSKFGMRAISKDKAGGEVLSITNFALAKGWVVYPAMKVYVDMQLNEEGNSKIMPEPATAKHMDNIYDNKPCRGFEYSQQLEMDTVDGKSVEKWTCMLARTERTTVQWYDPAMKMIIAEENDSSGKTIVKDIQSWTIDKTFYDLPAGYKQVTIDQFAKMAMQ